MQPIGFIDTNFILITVYTICLILATLIYLGSLHYMLKSKFWIIPLLILATIFGLTMFIINKDFQMQSYGSINKILMLAGLKLAVILHGIYYLSVLLGKYIGLKKATLSLKENEVLIVLMSIVVIIIMNNVHTFPWDVDRAIIMNIVNLVMIYILVNVVFYLGEVKYFFVYAVPVFLAFTYFYFNSSGCVDEKSLAFSQMQAGLIGTLLFSSVYFAIKIKLEFMDDRETSRIIEDVKMPKKESTKEESTEKCAEENIENDIDIAKTEDKTEE